MTFRQGIAYVLRHAWLWPLEFWIRPLDIIDRLYDTKQKTVEVICALLGGGLCGLLMGILIWLWTGEIQAVWILATIFVIVIVIVIVIVSTIATAVLGPLAVLGAGAVLGASAGTVVGVLAIAGAILGAGAGTGAGAGASAVLGAGVGTFLSLLAFIGIILGIWLPDSIHFFNISAAGCILIHFFS
jgi:hypothetical protein